MDTLDQLRAFIATAHARSFTAAADQLGISNRLTSKYVAALERRLGTRLFQRTTRNVSLTPAGENLMRRAPTILGELDELFSNISEDTRGLSGVLRISAPITFGQYYVIDMIARFGTLHPNILFNINLTDRHVDMASEGIDLAFRIGGFNMASLNVSPLGRFTGMLVASPDYLSEHGAPQTLSDLSARNCIVDTNHSDPFRWTFEDGGKEVSVKIQGRFEVNSACAAADLAKAGLGIAYVPSFALGDLVSSGALVPVLPDLKGMQLQFAAVYLDGRTVPRRAQALIDFAALEAKIYS